MVKDARLSHTASVTKVGLIFSTWTAVGQSVHWVSLKFGDVSHF